MDEVPFEFRERVAALWKCCELGDHPRGCLDARVPDCDWTMKSKKTQLIAFVIGRDDNGEWKHCFTNPSDSTEGSRSMDELKKHRNWKHFRIAAIEVVEKKWQNSARSLWSQNAIKREDVEKLMKFVAFLSNETRLELKTLLLQIVDSPEGATLVNSLSKMMFSKIFICIHSPGYNRILENQFSRRKTTEIVIKLADPAEPFLSEHLGNGNIKRFNGPFGAFPSAAMEGIIDRFLENPHKYEDGNLEIIAKFAETDFLERRLKSGLCERGGDHINGFVYRFKSRYQKLEKDQYLCVKNKPLLTYIWIIDC